MAEATGSKVPGVLINLYKLVTRAIEPGGDPKNPRTADGRRHECGTIVAHMRASTDGADFVRAMEEYFTIINAIEGGGPCKIIRKGLEVPKKIDNDFADGKIGLVRGKDFYPRSWAQVADLVNAAVDAAAATRATGYNNQFKPGAGATVSGRTVDDVDNLTD